MEKLENHIKNTLEERRIAPSAQAWDKVSGQIKVVGKRPSNRKLIYTVAASFIGIVLASIFFFQTEEPSENVPQIVSEENPKEETLIPSNVDRIPMGIEKEHTKIAVTEMENQPLEDSASDVVASVISDKTEAETINNQPLNDDVLNLPDGLISQKVNEVVAQVTLLENMNSQVSDAEVDSLLRAAQQQILSDKLFDSDKVDAMALLTQVEDELDESFRDQIFDALKEGYFKLRTAVADRNN